MNVNYNFELEKKGGGNSEKKRNLKKRKSSELGQTGTI